MGLMGDLCDTGVAGSDGDLLPGLLGASTMLDGSALWWVLRIQVIVL
jgi:hypothetical protein